MTCGIYCITNMINGMQYVGQSIDIEERFHQHITQKSNSKIHQAIAKYGVHNFKFEPLIECSENELDEQEVKFIRLLGTYENGYNQNRGGQHHVFNVEYDYKKREELQNEINEKNEVIRTIRKKNNSLELEVTSLRNKLKELKEENESLNTHTLLLEKTLKQRKNDEYIKSLKSRITYLERGAFTNLKNKNKQLKSENTELRFENEMLRQKNKKSVDMPKSNIFHKPLTERRRKIHA